MRNRSVNVIGGLAFLGFAGLADLQASSAPNLLTISPGITVFSPTGVGSTTYLNFAPTLNNPGTAPVTNHRIQRCGRPGIRF
jgi:hypothetical protein